MTAAESAELAESLAKPVAVPGRFLALADGLHHDVPESTYHERILGVASKGALELVRYAPAKYLSWVRGEDEPEEESRALFFGRAAHCGILEPEKYAKVYAVEPAYGDGRTKAAKEKKDAWRAEHAGAIPLSEADAKAIAGMKDAISRHPEMGPIFRALWEGKRGAAEVTIKWTCPESGLVCRSRDDLFIDGEDPEIIDLKSTADARSEEFNRSRMKFGYHRQEGHYVHGHAVTGKRSPRFRFLAVEKVPPYLLRVYELSPALRELGYRQIQQAKEDLARCVGFDDFPGLSPITETLEQFPWEK